MSTPGTRTTRHRKWRSGLPWLVLPVKGLSRGKGRLARLLSDASRRRLNELLLRHALTIAAAFPGGRRTLVVSRCAATLALARRYGAGAVRERRGGLNAAVTQGVQAIRARSESPVIVIACDLPLLRAHDLRTLSRRGLRLGADLVLCPDESGTGTNAIYIGEGVQLRFRFGAASLQKHLREAQQHGLLTKLYIEARIARDIDTPAQLRRWRHERRRECSRRASAIKKSGGSAKAAA